MKVIKRLISGILFLSVVVTTLSGMILTKMAEAIDDEIIYYQDFGTEASIIPDGWTIPSEAKYLKFNTYDNIPDGAPSTVSGVALNATLTGSGNRPAYVNIDDSIINPGWVQDYEVFDFDFYMAGGVNTCNIFTLGNKQENSYTDLTNTFFCIRKW